MSRTRHSTFLTLLRVVGAYVVMVTPACALQEKLSNFGVYRGYSQPVYDGWIRTSQYIPVRDGTKIAVDYFRPTRSGELHTERLPVVWTHTRYDRSNISQGKLNTMLDYMPWLITVLKHGYIVAAVDVRGAGASFGANRAWFPPTEAQDAYDITEWFAGQSWCNGSIGMYGLSYLGITQYFAASEMPPHLKAIIPAMAWFDEYAFVYPGGIFTDWPVYSWGTDTRTEDRNGPVPDNWLEIIRRDSVVDAEALAAKDARYRSCRHLFCATEGYGTAGAPPVAPVDGDTNLKNYVAAKYQHKANPNSFDIISKLPYRDSLDAMTKTPFNLERSLFPRLEAIERSGVAIYHVAGWYDAFSRDQLLFFRNLRTNPRKIMIGPWFHDEFDGALMAAESLRWFDHWLKGIENGVTKDPPIHYWTIGAPKGQEWQSATQWPLPDQKLTNYYFGPGPSGSIKSVNDGLLSTAAPKDVAGKDEYSVDYTTSSGINNRWTGTAGGATGFFDEYVDQLGKDRKGLTYTTVPLDSDIEITGHPVGHIWVTHTAKDGDLFVYLEQVAPDSASHYVTEGKLRASHRKLSDPPFDNMGLPYHRSYEKDITEMTPGTPTELVLDLLPVSVRFHKGDRIRITITCADKDSYDTPIASPTPKLTISRDTTHASYVTLPLIQR